MTILEEVQKSIETILSQEEVNLASLEDFQTSLKQLKSPPKKELPETEIQKNQDDIQEISLDEESSKKEMPLEEQKQIEELIIPQEALVLNGKQIQKLLSLVRLEKNRLPRALLCGKVFIILFEENLIDMHILEDRRVIINIINTLCNLVEILSGLDISFKIGSIISGILDFLLEQTDLGEEHRQYISSMQAHPFIGAKRGAALFAIHEKRLINMASSEDAGQRLQAINEVFDIFSQCASYTEQIGLFSSSSFTPVLKHLVLVPIKPSMEQEKLLKSLMILLAKLALTLLVPAEILIEVDPKVIASSTDAQIQTLEYFVKAKDTFLDIEADKQVINKERQLGNVTKYDIRGAKDILGASEGIYSNIALIVNSLLLFHKDPEILKYTLKILQFLHQYFPNFRLKLQSAISTVLSNISDISIPECEQAGAVFLFHLLSVPNLLDSSFFELLSSDPKISRLSDSSFFDEKYVTPTPFNKQIQLLQDFSIHKTFAMQQAIEAEQSFSYLIDIYHPFSIVYLGFATQSKDIKVHFSRIAELQDGKVKEVPEKIFINERIDCEQNPHRLVFLTEQCGIYQIKFDNSYSWYTSKLLRFRCLILEPASEERALGVSAIRKKMLFTPFIFESLNLQLFRKFDGNWCQLHIFGSKIVIEIDTFDHLALRKTTHTMDFAEVNEAVVQKFSTFFKDDFIGILVIYEKSAWIDLQGKQAQNLISQGFLSRKQVEDQRTQPQFQLLILKRLLQEKLGFLKNFKSLSLEAVEDLSYFWYKHCSTFLSPRNITNNNNDNSKNNPKNQVVLLQKCNPVTKAFVMKLYQDNQLNQIELENLEDEVFQAYELLLKQSDFEEYFSLYCNFITLFLKRHSLTLSVDSIIFYIDPDNLFWTDMQLKLLKTFLETQLPSEIPVPQLYKCTL